jgi:hypothetical protein
MAEPSGSLEPSTPTALASPRRSVACRPGTFALLLSEERDLDELAGNLVEQLSEDSRVLWVTQTDSEISSAMFYRFFDEESLSEGSNVVAQSNRRFVPRFSRPLQFAVHVPAKNQRKIRPYDDTPESYEVFWNGVDCLVGWEHDSTGPIPMSGGHIVKDILHLASTNLGLALLVQCCNASCDYDFLHTTIAVGFAKNGNRNLQPTRNRQIVRLTLPDRLNGEDISSILLGMYRFIGYEMEFFSTIKNIGRKILQLESRARHEEQILLTLQQDRAAELGVSWFARLGARWKSRSWRRQTSQAVATLWLLMTEIEYLHRRWAETKWELEDLCNRDRKSLMFELDHADEVAQIDSLDMDLIREATAHASSRLDNRAIVLATAGGAVAGGLVGAALAAVLAFSGVSQSQSSNFASPVSVPNVSALNSIEAEKLLSDSGLKVSSAALACRPSGISVVEQQSPSAGTYVQLGSTIELSSRCATG